MNRAAEQYRNFLIFSPYNYTCTHLAKHSGLMHPKSVYSLLSDQKIEPDTIWESVREDFIFSEDGILIFDDTVLDKRHSEKIEGAFLQYRGNEGGLVVGICVVACLYHNPKTGDSTILDYRIYDPKRDGKGKLAHAMDMFGSAVSRAVPFQTVLADKWYSAKEFMLRIEENGKNYVFPLKSNRKADDSGGGRPYTAVKTLVWSEAELESGKSGKLFGFPGAHRVRLFRVRAQDGAAEWVAANGSECLTVSQAVRLRAARWNVEGFFREIKQLTGVERCECRRNRSQRNHIALAMHAWLSLKTMANRLQTTLYEVRNRLFFDWLVEALADPKFDLPAIRLTPHTQI